MSHYYESEPRVKDLPPLPVGIEVIIARTRATDAEKSKPYGRTPHYDDQTVLVLLGPDAQSRRAARSHTARYMHAEIDLIQVPCDVWVDAWLGNLLCAEGNFITSIVFTSPTDSKCASKWVRNFIRRMKNAPEQHFEVAIAVSASPSDWQSTNFRAVVRSKNGREVYDALVIFDMLASLSAPEMIGAFDNIDLNVALGNPGDTLLLADGIWNPVDEVFCGETVLSQLPKGIETLILVIVTGFPSFNSFTQLLRHIGQSIGKQGTVLSLWTEGLMEKATVSRNYIPVHFLIRSKPPASRPP